ncbi:MAG: hypothetical protein ABGZ53_04185 [Fuerstiella sp.]
MARNAKVNADREQPRLGGLPPLHKLFLNPYTDIRFTSSCPSCCGKTRQRKLPLAIHVTDWGMVILNKTCRYCPTCELVICHQDEIEGQLAHLFAESEPQMIGNDYLVVGTLERKDWRRGLAEPLCNSDMLAALHDFEGHLQFEPAPRWECSGRQEGPPNPR